MSFHDSTVPDYAVWIPKEHLSDRERHELADELLQVLGLRVSLAELSQDDRKRLATRVHEVAAAEGALADYHGRQAAVLYQVARQLRRIT